MGIKPKSHWSQAGLEGKRLVANLTVNSGQSFSPQTHPLTLPLGVLDIKALLVDHPPPTPVLVSSCPAPTVLPWRALPLLAGTAYLVLLQLSEPYCGFCPMLFT